MSNWASSDRRDRLPSNWPGLRRQALAHAGGICQSLMLDSTRCDESARDVDHIEPGDDHSPENLQALCPWHHKMKTNLESTAARAARPKRTNKHPGEKHPSGLSFFS